MLLRDAVSRGHAIGQAALLSDVELKELGLRTADVAREVRGANSTEAAPLAALIASIEAFDSAAANEEMGKLAAVMPATDLVTKIALPLMRVVGQRWHEGTLKIAHEHMASGLLRNLFGSLLRLYKPLNPVVKVVFATPSGEHHEFGILAGAMLAAPLGLEPIYLGSNLPAEEILGAAQKAGARVIVIGLMDQPDGSAPLRELRLLAESAPPEIEIWLGGRGLDDQPVAMQQRIAKIQNFPEFEQKLRALRMTA
jgi:methanogenic corrinoid protein MtbC1